MNRLCVLLAVAGLVALLGCGSGLPKCDDPETVDALVANSEENPWYTSGNLIIDLTFGEELSYKDGWGYECRGVGKFQEGVDRLINYRVQPVNHLDRGWDVGFNYDGRIGIPKSEWDAGRRE